MLYDMNEQSKKLYNQLNEQGYSEDILTACNDLCKMIGEYDEENPKNIESKKVYEKEEVEEDKSEDSKESEDSEEETKEVDAEEGDVSKMNLKDHKNELKKKRIIITVD